MDSVFVGLNVLLILLGTLLLIGLYKPHVVLWWEDQQYRLKVLKVYGTAIVLIVLAKLIIPLV